MSSSIDLSKAIHARWAAVAALETGAIPSSRVHTGQTFDPTLPFAVIERNSGNPITQHNDGAAVDSVGVRFQVFHANHDAGATVIHEIKGAFNPSEFAPDNRNRQIYMEQSNPFELPESDGARLFVIDFTCKIHLPAGV